MQVREYLLKGVIQNAVNVPSVTFDEYTEMLPYIGLAERLGAFLAQSGENGVEEIGIAYGGELSEWKTDLIRNAAVAGVLNQMAHEKANLVNARSIAEERGIRVNEQKIADVGTRVGDQCGDGEFEDSPADAYGARNGTARHLAAVAAH